MARGGLRLAALCATASLMLSACGGGAGGGVTPTPAPSPVRTPGALACTSGGTSQSMVRESRFSRTAMPHRTAAFGARPTQYAADLLEVVYDRSAYIPQRSHTAVSPTLDFPSTNRVVRVVRVQPSEANAEGSALRAQAGVRSVSRVAYRYALSTTPALTNDPYYQGFAPDNAPPFYEGTSSPGQWDMHVICAANAWGYANANTTGKTFSGAAGGAVAAPIAIVDTGADLTHPELRGRVTYAETVLNGVVTSGLSAMHDNDGHGTNVTGIAGATGNNALGFTGVAYAAPLMIFKVFPDPPSGGCADNEPPKPKCVGALGSDIAIAITDAVNHGAKVINLSLGDSSPDTAEENAVANAIARGAVVVAAAGNESSIRLDYPAADPGVIAVGASGLDDSNPASSVETVASFSNYDSTNPNTWGVVAPGGTATASSDNDNLHWIENIYTSTAADGSSTQACAPDRAGGIGDCRQGFTGTSQASPHVAGAVALLLSVGALPGQMKTILCNTAMPVSGGKAGCGRIDVYRAMAQVVGDPTP